MLLGRLVDDAALAALRAEHDAAVDDAVRAARYPSRELCLRLILQWPDMWRRGPAWRALRDAPAVAAWGCALLGVDAVRLVGLSVVAKAEGGGPSVPWHQDLPAWPTADARGVTVWIALDRVGSGEAVGSGEGAGEAAGALRYLSLPPAEATSPPLDAPDPVTVPLRAGEAVAHHASTWHASLPNRGGGPRRGVVVALVAADAAPRGGGAWDEERHPVLAGR